MKRFRLVTLTIWILIILFVSNSLWVALGPQVAVAAGEKADWKAK